MKKMICLLLAICMTGSLCACGAGETELQTDMPTEMIAIKTTPATIPETMPKETVLEQTQPEMTAPMTETTIPETAHQHSYVPEKVEATCTEDGYTVYTCACGDNYQEGHIKALGHDYKHETVEPTETKQGYTKHTCVHCGQSYKDNYTDPIPPKTDETVPPVTTVPEETIPETTAPVVTAPETTETVETVPEETIPETTAPQETVPTHIHSYTSKVTPPTCTEKGYTTFACECGDSYTADEVDTLRHDYEIEEVEATDTSYGYNLYTCKACGHSYKDSLGCIPAKDVEAAILKYINQFRGSSLTKLSGMSKVAKRRSKQIISNFAHDTNDIREAHAYYQYGKYIDMAEYGGDPAQNHYTSSSGEAIAYRGQSVFIENADQMGKEIAEQIRNSSSHWSYIGDPKYTYCGIGAIESAGIWYVCIMVNTQNYG